MRDRSTFWTFDPEPDEFRSYSGAMGGSFIVDGEGTILGFDEAMEALTGRHAFHVVGHEAGAAAGAGLPLFEGKIDVPRDSATVLLQIHCADGRGLGVEAFVRRLAGKGDRAQVTVLRILTRSAARSADSDREGVDGLTGLSAGERFLGRLDEEIRRSKGSANPLAIVLADVDHLRTVNDTHGRDAGDRILRDVADMLRVAVRDEDNLGRLGEDDFGIILPRSGRGDARQVASVLRSMVERYRPAAGGLENVRVTLSLGAASLPADAESSRDLISRAREALDEARSQGRNRVWCYLRRPRIPVQVPIFFDGVGSLLVGYTRDLSPSGVFVQTSAPIDIGMRCAFAFPLPGHDGNVHVIGRVVRSVSPDTSVNTNVGIRIPGMGVEFERFGGPQDRRAIEAFLHGREDTTLRPETGDLSL